MFYKATEQQLNKLILILNELPIKYADFINEARNVVIEISKNEIKEEEPEEVKKQEDEQTAD